MKRDQGERGEQEDRYDQSMIYACMKMSKCKPIFCLIAKFPLENILKQSTLKVTGSWDRMILLTKFFNLATQPELLLIIFTCWLHSNKNYLQYHFIPQCWLSDFATLCWSHKFLISVFFFLAWIPGLYLMFHSVITCTSYLLNSSLFQETY